MGKNSIKEELNSLSLEYLEKESELRKLKIAIKDKKFYALKLYLVEEFIPLINQGKIYYSHNGKSIKVKALNIVGYIKVYFGSCVKSGFYFQDFRMLKPGSDNMTIPFDFKNLPDYGLSKRDLMSFGYIQSFDSEMAPKEGVSVSD